MHAPPLPRRRGTGGNSPEPVVSLAAWRASVSCRRPPDHLGPAEPGAAPVGAAISFDRSQCHHRPRGALLGSYGELEMGVVEPTIRRLPLGAGGLRPSLRLFRDRTKGAVSQGAASFFSMLVPGLVYPFSPSGAPNPAGAGPAAFRAGRQQGRRIVMVGSEGPST